MTRSIESWGILVMRCQGHHFKPGWRHMIEHAMILHQNVLVVIGTTGGWPTKDNPLTFDMVSGMMKRAFAGNPNIRYISLSDSPLSHNAWSEDLDVLIEKTCLGAAFKMYYSRDGFDKWYTGKYKNKVVYVEPIEDLSGTEMRSSVTFPHTDDARAAIVNYHQTRDAFSYPAVDTAIIDSQRKRGILIKQRKFRMQPAFAGGMFDPIKDNCYEDTSKRETHEEVPTVEAGPPQYVGSEKIDDPRYRKSQDRVVSTLFYREYLGGDPSGGDDADDAQWYNLADFYSVIVPHHRILVKRLQIYLVHVGVLTSREIEMA